MHPKIFQEFEATSAERHIKGAILGVGAIPSRMSLLAMKSLGNAMDGQHWSKVDTCSRRELLLLVLRDKASDERE